MFPDFSDFLKLLTNEQMEVISQSVNKQLEGKDLNEMEYAIHFSSVANVGVLKLYHQWLQESFENHDFQG